LSIVQPQATPVYYTNGSITFLTVSGKTIPEAYTSSGDQLYLFALDDGTDEAGYRLLGLLVAVSVQIVPVHKYVFCMYLGSFGVFRLCGDDVKKGDMT